MFSYTVTLAGLPIKDAERSKVGLEIFAQLPMRKYIARVKWQRTTLALALYRFFFLATPTFYNFYLMSLD